MVLFGGGSILSRRREDEEIVVTRRKSVVVDSIGEGRPNKSGSAVANAGRRNGTEGVGRKNN